MKLRIAPFALATVFMLAWTSAPAQDAAALFKTRCAPCHGDQGQGKPNMGPKLAGTNKDVVTVLTKGGEAKAPHVKPMATITPAQANALATYIKSLK